MLRVLIDIGCCCTQPPSHVRRFWYSFLCCQKRIDKKLISGVGPREFFLWQVGNESEGVWNVYFGLMTITESMWPLPSSSVAELVGSFTPTPSTRNLYVYLPGAKSRRQTHPSPSLAQ